MQVPDSPEVSIVTPLYNAAAYIRSTIESVLSQTFEDWEYIIVDDASTDMGPAIVEGFAKDDSRISLLRLQENSGAGISRNAGIKAARGKYIAFLDSDDEWLPEKLERQIAFMKTNEAVFTFTDFAQMSEDGIETTRIIRCPQKLSYRRQLRTNYVGCSTAIYDTEYYGKRYFPVIRKRQDYGLWLDILAEGTPGRGLSETLTKYRVRKTGLSGNKLELIQHNWRLYRQVLGFNPVRSVYYLGWNIAIKLLGRR